MGVSDIFTTVRTLAATIDRFDDTAARRLGLHRTDLRALHLLEHGPVAMGQLATSLRVSTGTITALVDRLERDGFVRRVDDPNDRRRVLVELEPAAWRAFATIYRPCGEAVRQVAGTLTPDEAAATIRTLRAVTDAVDAVEAALHAAD
jgi:DNA-binding MarR family transcriptional regulator